MTAERGITIIIPAYNEQNSISSVLAGIHNAMGDSLSLYEVIVVDDGSTDNTTAYVDQRQNRLLRHSSNRGYGAALKTGIRHAHYELIAITDADGTYPNHRIPCLLDVLTSNECDMVVGARTGEQVTIPPARRPAKWAITRLAEFVVGQPIPDLNSGLRVFQRDTIQKFLDLLPSGFSFTATITLAMLSNGYQVKYLPINYYPRVSRSKIRPLRDTLTFIGLILRIALYFAPLKIFIPFAGFLLLLGLLWGAFSKLVLGELADVSTMIVVMSAFQIGALGLLAELINRRTSNLSR
jgi:glycosyltransferase involved in cell wall biosynthesis